MYMYAGTYPAALSGEITLSMSATSVVMKAAMEQRNDR